MKKYYGEGDRQDMIRFALRLQNGVTGLIRHLADSDDPEWIRDGLHDLREEIDRFDKANEEFYNPEYPPPSPPDPPAEDEDAWGFPF